jgi:hypothetical protein
LKVTGAAAKLDFAAALVYNADDSSIAPSCR